MRSGLIFVSAAAILSIPAGGCFLPRSLVGPFPGPPLPTVDGPEEPELLREARGTLVVLDREDPSHLQVVSLPSLEQRRIAVANHTTDISGPDSDGRVVYIQEEGDYRGDAHCLRVASLVNGSDRLLLTRKGCLNPCSKIVLSPSGGLVAFLSSVDRGGYDYTPWNLEVIDITTGGLTKVDGAITQHTPCWLPDGWHLAYVEWRFEDRTLTTSILDVQSGERRVVREGRLRGMVRGVAPGGASLLFGEGEHLCRVAADTGLVLEDDLRLPGNLDQSAEPTNSWAVVADLGDGKFLYDALPTAGVPQKLRAGFIWPNDVKLCDVRTGRFVTVVSQLWGVATYGSLDPTERVLGRRTRIAPDSR
jgi:hypothetical protein